MNEIKIIERDDVIAQTLTDESGEKTILLNPNLRKYGDLYEQVLAHEMEHVKSPGVLDAHIEFRELLKVRNQWNMTRFFWNNKRLFFSQFLSFGMHINGKFYPDYFKILAAPIIFLSFALVGLLIGGLI